MSKTLVASLARIQSTLKAPKSQYNKFGQYAYRNQEDILEAVKPLLAKEGLVQTISDEIISVGGRVYVRATVQITDGNDFIQNQAFAREPQDQKGMNEAQITGSASSYARKYALNGMYAIDDTKDADATNDHGKAAPAEKPQSRPLNTRVDVTGSLPETTIKAVVSADANKAEVANAGPVKEAAKPEEKKASRFAPKKNTEAPKSDSGNDNGWN